MVDLDRLKGLSDQDRKLLEDAERMFGPEPTEMGFVKNLFWGNVHEDLIFPYPAIEEEESSKCEDLLSVVDKYLRQEHPAIRIDQEEEIPRWVIDRLFEMGVMGMTIPQEYGGLGMSVTSYNRILERIGATCASTAVLVSAHQSIGCKSILLFGTESQKRRWLPRMAKSEVSAFSLSESNVGCDAGAQQTHCNLSEDGQYYVVNGEKKWSTSAAISGLITVMVRHRLLDPKTGKEQDRVTALLCTPDMPGIDIYEKNRSKCGIRGTWQARIRFDNVKVPRENLLHEEGKGLTVALSCLNYGRCTLSAGMLGSARRCMDQAIKWSQTRYQFGRPLSAFELVRDRIASMSALTYGMDAVLYMTTRMLDRHDKDIMLETALCKVFCSEMGWRVVNDAMQIMGGEGYMVENEVERSLRDSRINLIVEGANEVMQTFVFGYGGKQLAEHMLGILQAYSWDRHQSFRQNLSRIVRNLFSPVLLVKASLLVASLYLGVKKRAPQVRRLHSSLVKYADQVCRLVQEHHHQYKLQSKKYREMIIKHQLVQARLSDSAMWLFAMMCVLSKLDSQIRNMETNPQLQRDKEAALHFFDLASLNVRKSLRDLEENADLSMRAAAEAALVHNDTLPNSDFIIPEKSPVAAGSGRTPPRDGIKQFPGNKSIPASQEDRVQDTPPGSTTE